MTDLQRIMETIHSNLFESEEESKKHYLSTDLKQWELFSEIEPEYLGEGGNWTVFGISLKKPVAANNRQYKRCALKINKNKAPSRVKDYVENFEAIRSSGIKTVGFCLPFEHIDYAVVCEDLNDDYRENRGEYLYVSPNTSKYRDKEISILNPIYEEIGKGKHFIISDFECTVENLIQEMSLAGDGKNSVGISEDVLFIGVKSNHDGSVSLDYKAADFDTVCMRKYCSSGDFQNLNCRSMITTLKEFVNFFLSDSSDVKDQYEEYLNGLYERYPLF